jgi:GAF domain-containing protein
VGLLKHLVVPCAKRLDQSKGKPVAKDDLYARMALELEGFESTDEALETIIQYARVAVDADDAGILLLHGEKVETPAGTSKEIDKVHQLQAELNEGPCLEAVTSNEDTYLVTNTLGDERWPTWGKAAADIGYYSVISSKLETRSRVIGSLNAYSRRVDAFNDHDVEVMQLLAAHASVAIAASRMRSELHTALRTRTTIGQAQGVLMNAFGISSDQAFAYMRRLSQDQNVKLFKIAEQIIASRDDLSAGQQDTGT